MLYHTIRWYEGEIFEARFIFAFGTLLILSALLFRIFGTTEAPKALLVPLIAIGFLFSAIGGYMNYDNKGKMIKARVAYNQDRDRFLTSELKRVEDFQYLYPMSLTISGLSFLIAIALLAFAKNISLQATAISLIVLGMTFAVIDYFSKERATAYYHSLNDLKYVKR